MEEDVSKRMGISIKEYKEKIQNEMWLYDKNAVKENAADEVIQIKCSKELLNQRLEEQQTSGFFFFSSTKTVVYSGCPLLRKPIGEIKEIKKDTSNSEHLY